jgi:hypothetical protein
VGKCRQKRKLGNPGSRWEDNIKINLQKYKLKIMRWTECTVHIYHAWENVRRENSGTRGVGGKIILK